MSIRATPQQSIMECLPTAVEIADLRVVNKDLNFIQANIKRANDLASQAASSSDYAQLVSITDKFASLTKRAQDRSETLKEFSNDLNPLTQINDSSQFLDKVQILKSNLEQRTNDLSDQFTGIASSKYENYNNTINELSQSITSISSHQEFTEIYKNFELLLKDIGENARYLNNDNNASDFVNKLESLAKQYQQKAEVIGASFESEMATQIGMLNERIGSLNNNVDYLNSSFEIDANLEKLSELREIVNSLAPQLKTISGSEEMVLNLNSLSLASYSKVDDMINGYKAVEKLMPQVNNPDLLANAVREASFRTDVSYIDNVLMPLINKPNDLSARLIELAAQFESSNIGQMKVGVVKNIDNQISRLERTYMSISSTDPETLSGQIVELSDNVSVQFETVRSVDPSSQLELFSDLSSSIADSVDASGLSIFLNNAQSISQDVMMNSRQCVDSAFKDFTRDVGSTMEKIFDPLLYFLAQFEQLLLATPWPLFLAIAGALAWLGSKSYKVSIGVMLAFFAIGYLGMWTPMISTVTMITAATLLCLTLGIPLGIWMSRSDRAQSMITPVLDIMQTIPSFVYLIPVVMLLGIGKVPGLIAVCIYAMPPIVRLTNLGIRLVNKEAMEAADAFGATYRQRLFMVQIPLALPNIFAGVNQTIMMALSMVVIASMIGVTGLGLPVLQAVQNQYLSLGLLNGLAIVALAIIFDRVSQAFGTRIQKHRSGDVL